MTIKFIMKRRNMDKNELLDKLITDTKKGSYNWYLLSYETYTAVKGDKYWGILKTKDVYSLGTRVKDRFVTVIEDSSPQMKQLYDAVESEAFNKLV